MAKKRGSFFRLIIMIVIAILLFMGLALGEDYAKGFMKKWRRQNKTVATRGDSDIAKIVTRYNQILEQAYEKERPSLLQPVATENQITKVRLYMTYDQVEKKRKLITKLISLTVDEAKKKVKKGKKGKKAAVQTTESWENSYQDLDTKMMSDKKTESYKVQYNLIKSGEEWLVDSLEAKKI